MHEKVSVITIYDQTNGKAYPWRIKWRERVYTTTTVGYHHTISDGNILCHIFSVVAGSMYFRLKLNTKSLAWILEEAADSMASI